MAMYKYLERSANALRDNANKIYSGEYLKRQTDYLVASVYSKADLARWTKGTDRDIGGFSDAWLDVTRAGHARFHGYLSQKLPEDTRFKRSGYAMVRTRDPQMTLLSTDYWDAGLFRYLVLRVKADRRKYFVNLKSDALIPTDIYQHLLPIRTPGQWETVVIPFNMFTLTSNSVIIASQPTMYLAKMETVGFSLSDRQEGPFSLEFAWIKAFNSARTHGNIVRMPFVHGVTWKTDFERMNKNF
ncbi:hypothetical protein LPJ61_003714 [Coemansia biformis]|uniref:NADH:ubiquinone oxidoreductase intermediate-associated protein 30 domain-containing protein n=1 Tax=Coemansia biformis TaxID=1286918 RepID=A0A9W7YC12_9FUNG|nr:hypothetical protein LPJ61_003714 [Coemansia biformis]